jgi:short-subunit dehydrogenase
MSDISGFQGKVVVITGASSGFGEGTARELARRGACLVLAARSADTIHALARECESLGGQAIAVKADVGEREAVEMLASEAISRFGRIDVWINNAGVAAIGRFDVVPLEDHERVVRTDLLGTLYGSHIALRHFRERGAGNLINVASVIGKIPTPLYSSYAASKFGVVGLSDVLRQELRADKINSIRVCTVMPMAHSTDFFEHAGNYTGHEAEPIPPTYDPKVTIDALVSLVAEPRDEVITGGQGIVFDVLHRLMPNAVEWMMTKNVEKVQVENAPPAPTTSGNVHNPSKNRG